HAILVEDGRRDVRGVVGDARVAEHRLAVRGPYADGSGVGHRHHRANALHVPDDRRGVAGSIAEALAGPDGPPRHLVERNEGRVAAPRRDDDVVAVDEGGLAEQPLDVASVEVAEDVALPDRRPVLGLEAGEVAIPVRKIAVSPSRQRFTFLGARLMLHREMPAICQSIRIWLGVGNATAGFARGAADRIRRARTAEALLW